MAVTNVSSNRQLNPPFSSQRIAELEDEAVKKQAIEKSPSKRV